MRNKYCMTWRAFALLFVVGCALPGSVYAVNEEMLRMYLEYGYAIIDIV